MKLGSLFDGIGGFPLAASRYGIEPVWASEIEPWPIKVTKKHFPNMKHLGDITKINGAEIEPVDIITFGSPCQDLSVAGKRAGLGGERSGLFMDAVRIIREMRRATGGQYPRWAVWENVPGAFSSNKGEDFRAVLSEIAETEIPMPRSGKWANAGMVRTATADIAWRVLDAQYWGVPQRRRRIFLVADFGGECAAEVLFEQESLSGDFAESRKARQEVAATTGDGVEEPNCLTLLDCQSKAICIQGSMIGRADKNGPQGDGINEDVSFTLNTIDRHAVVYGIDQQGGKGQANYGVDVMPPLCSDSHGTPHAVAYNAVATVDCRNFYENVELSGTIQAKENGGYSLNYQNPVRVGYVVRRLTPLECLRLQGFPDWWLDIEGMSDTQKYKVIGNSIAIPCAMFVMAGIAKASTGARKEDDRSEGV